MPHSVLCVLLAATFAATNVASFCANNLHRPSCCHVPSSSHLFADIVADGTDIVTTEIATLSNVEYHSDESIAAELKDRYIQLDGAAVVAEQQPRRDNYVCRRLAKEIWRDWDNALDTLCKAYPYLDHHSPSVPLMRKQEIHLDGKAISAAIEVLGRTKKLDEAFMLLDQTADIYTMLSSIAIERNDYVEKKCLEADMRSCYRAAITAAGASGDWRVGLMLLHRHMPERVGLYPNAEAYHSQIAACKKCGAVDAALCLLTEMEVGRVISSRIAVETSRPVPSPDRMAYVVAITACGQNKRCDEAASLLERMRKRGIAPGISEYNQVLSAYGQGRHKDALRLLKVVEEDDNVLANSETYNIVVKCCGKDDAWDEASRIMRKSGALPSLSDDVLDRDGTDVVKEQCKSESSHYYIDLHKLPRHGTGKNMYWEIGRYQRSDYSSIIVGLQPHRNPLQNGLSLVFMDDSTSTSTKLGFMLLRHTSEDSSTLFSALIGMLVDEKHRGKGLSSTFVAIWLRLCVDLGVFPRAENIRKPLISVALDKFGFQPQKGRVAVEVSSISDVDHHGKWEADIALYSPSHQSLNGLYRERDMRVQKMMVSTQPPNPRGKLVHVGCGFHHPVYNPSNHDNTCQGSLDNLRMRIDETLQRSGGTLSFNDDVDLLKKASFGFVRHA